jgi:hypothetical protein
VVSYNFMIGPAASFHHHHHGHGVSRLAGG